MLEAQTWLTDPNGTCVEWSCAATFASCRIDGGRGWNGTKRGIWDSVSGSKCEGTPATFSYAEAIWKFFERISLPAHGAVQNSETPDDSPQDPEGSGPEPLELDEASDQ